MNKTFSNINVLIKNNKLSYRGSEIPLTDLFKIKRSTGNYIPKSEDDLREIFKSLGLRFTRTGSINHYGKFFSMTWVRNRLKTIPQTKRNPVRRPRLPFLRGIRARPQRDSEPVNLRYVRNRPFGQIEIEIERSEIIFNNTLPELANVNNLRRVLNRYLANNTSYKIVLYADVPSPDEPDIVPVIENKIGYVMRDVEGVSTISKNSSNQDLIHLGKIFGKLHGSYMDYGYNTVFLAKIDYDIKTDTFYSTDDGTVESDFMRRHVLGNYNNNIIYRFIPLVDVNQPLLNQRDGEMNCACKIVLDELDKNPSKRNEFKKKHVMKINEKYLATGIDDEGLQELANKSYMTLIIKDKIGETWKEFTPSGNDKKGKKLLLISHNNHISIKSKTFDFENEPYDEDDAEEEKEEFKAVEVFNEDWKPKELRDLGQKEIWFDNNQDVIDRVNKYENEGGEGQPIMSKGQLVAYITPDVIWKTKFYEYEWYEQCFTSGGVGKEKFLEQMEEQKLDYTHGVKDNDPFYSLLMDADRSGFYSRTAESSKNNTKYDQNKAYKSFSKSGLFNGFPILEAVFKIDKPFSEIVLLFEDVAEESPEEGDDYQKTIDDMFSCDCDGKCEFCLANTKSSNESDLSFISTSDPFLNCEWLLNNNPKVSQINNQIHNRFLYTIESKFKSNKNDFEKYESIPLSPSGLGAKLLRENNCKHGLLYVEWDTLTAEKLNNKIYYEGNGWYPIEIVKEYYKTYGINPFIKSYAYASETFNVDFQTFTNDQFRTFLGKCISKSYDDIWRTKDYYEFMRARYILRERVISINYCDEWYSIVYASDKKPWNMPVVSAYVKAHQKYNLFQQYNKLIENGIVPVAVSVDGIEVKVKCDHLFNIGTNNGQWKIENIYMTRATEPSVIERPITEPRGTIEFSRDLILSKFLHISGAGGNGKSQYIIKLAKAYPGLMFMAPTHDAVKNLLDRASELNVKINVGTYHKVFGFGCFDRFPRNKYTRFVLDECSMLSAENLMIIMNKLNPTQSLLLAGDFCQLPCIEETPIYDNWTGEKSKEYKKFEIRELTKNFRQQEDPEFFSLCNSLRGQLTKDKAREILDVLNTRVVATLPENEDENDIHICGINTQIDQINQKYELEINCKVICNINCNDNEGNFIPNGSIGRIETISPLRIIWSDGIESTFKGVGKTNSKKPRFTPAYALTIHKAQGKTIKRNVIINPTRLFAKNHLYVALTRATKFSSIFFTEAMSFNTFCKTVNVY